MHALYPAPGKVASIDIGTNTILLLIGEFSDGKIIPLYEKETIARLGEGLQKSGTLSEEAMKRGVQTLSEYLRRCRSMNVEKILAVGTSALREAGNAQAFLNRVREELGLTIEIISGEVEARFSFLAVVKDLGIEEQTVVVDVGGGSTELIVGKDGLLREWVSLPLGAVRFTEQFLRSDPVRDQEWEAMEDVIRKALSQVRRGEGSLSMVAVGGTATTLAAVDQGLRQFDVQKIHHFRLTRESLEHQLLLYRSKTIRERKNIPGLSPERADVIAAGGAILYGVMEEFDCPSLLVSCHGVRYGLLYAKLTPQGSSTD